jgi:hypothetical protein
MTSEAAKVLGKTIVDTWFDGDSWDLGRVDMSRGQGWELGSGIA